MLPKGRHDSEDGMAALFLHLDNPAKVRDAEIASGSYPESEIIQAMKQMDGLRVIEWDLIPVGPHKAVAEVSKIGNL